MNPSFLEAVLPETGAYCVVGIKDKRPKQKFVETLLEVEEAAQALDNGGVDAFFALASFDDTKQRKVDNALRLRSFFVDLDCGPKKPYPDALDAINALSAFVDAAELPRPYIVKSGSGVHAYWPFEESIEVSKWVPAARSFKALCVQHELAIDLSVTADAARILRVPGTHNYKRETPAEVILVVSGEVTPYSRWVSILPAPTVDLSAARAYGTDELTRNLAQGDMPKSDFVRIVRKSIKGSGCAQIKHAIEDATSLEEPLWRAALSIAWNCVDAETAIHKLSNKHPDYTEQDTIEKAQALSGKPYTCDWYRQNNPSRCEGCTHRVGSPIMLGKIVEAAEPQGDAYYVTAELNPEDDEHQTVVDVEIPAYPYPYFRGIKGGVYRKDRNVDGEPVEVEIYPQDLYVTARYFDSDEHGDGEGEVVGINLHLPRDGVRRFHAPVVSLLTKDKLRDVLVKHGVIAIGKQLDNIMGYLASSIRKLQAGASANKTRSQMGWTPEHNFVVGELEYTPAGTKLAPPASSTRQLAPLFHAHGDLEEWKSVIDYYGREGMEGHAFAFFVGVGSTLLQLLNSTQVRGAVLNLVSNASGTGKTTVQMAINSMFGHPVELLMGQRDTVASMFQRLGTLNSISMTVDEMTNATPEELSKLIYSATSGRGNHRMNASSNTLRANHTKWCSIMVTSSNAVMADALTLHKSAADGELKRVIDFPIAVPPNIDKAETDAIFTKLADNYGLAGPIFIQHVVANLDSVAATLHKMQLKIDEEWAMERGDRFYSAIAAVGMTAGLYMQRLGLHNIDMKAVYKHAKQVLGDVKDSNIAAVGNATVMAQETLAKFINENVNNVLVINAGKDGEIPAGITPPKGALRMRYEPDTQDLVIVAQDLKKFFVERRIDFRSSLAELRSAGVLRVPTKPGEFTIVRRIAAGAVGSLNAPPTRCYVFDGKALGMNAVIANEVPHSDT